MTARRGVTVEPDGAVFCGLAVPFGETAWVQGHDGEIIAERFDADSIRTLPSNVPLLVSHRRDEPPAGVVAGTAISTTFGVGVEGKLIGSDHEIEGWRRRFAEGLMCGLSIGFTASGRQQWQLPERRGAPPLVVRRNVEIVELSLVQWPAYESAGMTSLHVRTAQAQRTHEVADEMFAEYKARRAKERLENERFMIETRVFLKGVDDLLARRGR
ncbi:MAG: HK97 family phage prohead protease [Candidatus Sericytochromatia bacterium]